ncbi:response regulator [Aquibium oceanicum]|uniref:Response regulatory domain-containing protein n=1 Tax=Aquibium oceanicum TaxID=1670800 RepID=A0A1L3SNB5_9HYPH|nr:hypothetical protein [Aquibium oceanicum]APH70825.1 hypothetical protein BSQ44_05090 [Aquibium oceanicum]
MPNLEGMRILIAEDEYILADDLTRYFEASGAKVLGPAPTVERARQLLPMAQAAILDVNLNGEYVFPLADELANRGVPFVFFTGYDEVALPERFRFVSSLTKPSGWSKVIDALMNQIRHGPGGERASLVASQDDVASLLPKLRLSARLMLFDPNAADRLVEETLEQAVTEIGVRPAGVSTASWLNALMEKTLVSRGRDLLH